MPRGGHNFKDLTGQRFGRWTVLSRAANTGSSAAWNVRCDCGTTSTQEGTQLRHGNTKSCGCLSRDLARARRKNKHHGWKGGRSITKNGYVAIAKSLIEECYPHAVINSQRQQVYEHIAVMSNHLRRALFPDETVHHKNGIRHDNRLDNLELWVKPQPTGIRVDDAVKWAEVVLTRYGTSPFNPDRSTRAE